MDWTEKYRPKTLSDIIISGKTKGEFEKLKKWAYSWNAGEPEKKSVIIHGPPGIGKTTTALALANDFGWEVIELNASDLRNKDIIESIVFRGAVYETFNDYGEFLKTKEGRRKLIILDEADNIFGMEDKGGLQAIVSVIKNAMQPIILIANDFYYLTRRSPQLRYLCLEIKFFGIYKEGIKAKLIEICEKERIRITPEAFELLVERANGDLRSAINDLQALCQGRKEILLEDVLIMEKVLGKRDALQTPFEVLSKILKHRHLEDVKKIPEIVDKNPEEFILWIGENLPLYYRIPEDLKNAYYYLSRADVFLGRVSRRQYYKLWSYANDLMNIGVCFAKKNELTSGFVKFQSPTWLREMGRTKFSREMQNTISRKIGSFVHCSVAYTKKEFLPYFKQMFANEEFAIEMIQKFNFEEDEVSFLIGEKTDSKRVEHLLKSVYIAREKEDLPKVEEFDGEEVEKTANQRNLTEF